MKSHQMIARAKATDAPFNKVTCAKRIKQLIRQEKLDRIKIGRELLAAKKALGHGEFRAWAQDEFSFSKNSISNYMNLAKKADDLGDAAVTELPAKEAYASHKPTRKIPTVGIMETPPIANLAGQKPATETDEDRWLYAFDAAEMLVETLGAEMMTGRFSGMTKLEWFVELYEGAGARKFEIALRKLAANKVKEAA